VPLGFGLVAWVVAGVAPTTNPDASRRFDLAHLAPDEPKNVVATALSSRRVQVTWDAVISSPGVKHYNVYRADGSLFTSTTPGYIDTAVQPLSTYAYRIAAVDSLDQEGPRSTPPASVTTPAADNSPPTTPTGLAATFVGATNVDLSWAAASDPETGVASYNIYRDGVLAGSSTGTTFSDTGLQVNRTYAYTVSAVNGDDLEGFPSSAIFVTTFDTTPPTAPTGLTGTAASATRVDLSWTAASDPETGVASYNIHRDGIVVGSSATTSFSDTGLSGNTTYTYEVTAVNGARLEGPRSTSVPVRTLDDTPPTAPSGLSAQAVAHDRVSLAWSAAGDPESGVAGYNIYRDGAIVGFSTSTSFSDTGLTGATQYSYRVTAVNGDGLEGPPTAAVVVTTPSAPDTTPPTVPTGLGATATSPTSVDLTWSASSDPESGVASYNIYRDGARVGSSSTTSFTNSGVQAGTTYSYQVSAINGDGIESALSAPRSVTTPSSGDTSPPTVPGGLVATLTGPTRVTLVWSAATDAESGVTSYRIYRNGAVRATSTTTTFADTTVVANTQYTYQVSAVNGAGIEGGRSAPVAVTTPRVADTIPPAAPTRLRIVP
jgi:chitodextrinase